MAGLLGAAWTVGNAATTAYNYNMSRFQFDANQRIKLSYQLQDMRNALWHLFREDIRDLFGITTWNLRTYMTISTLFTGYILHMIWEGLKEFPSDPPWLVVFYCNCLYTAIAYAVLAVWLAMHGTLAAHAGEVKVLTQAVRPPIPTRAEIIACATDLSEYETAGLSTLFRVPNLLNWRGNAAPSQNHREACATGGDNARGGGLEAECQRQQDAQATPCSATNDRVHEAESKPPNATWATYSEHTNDSQEMQKESERIARLLEGSDGAPGRSALLNTHVAIFRQLQTTYLTFEAYSRVSLLVASFWLMLIFAYFILAHLMAKHDTESMVSRHPEIVSWTGACVLPFIAVIVFNLDMYVEKKSMRLMMLVVLAGPLVATLAISLWNANRKYRMTSGREGTYVPDIVPEALALVACLLHLVWELLLLWQARPGGAAKLPMSFRAVQYSDLFGWFQKPLHRLSGTPAVGVEDTTDTASGAIVAPSSKDVTEPTEVASQLRNISETIQAILAPAISVHIATDDVRHLSDIHIIVQAIHQSLRERATLQTQSTDSSGLGSDGEPCTQTPASQVWLECLHVADLGGAVPYFVNCSTEEVEWERPVAGQVTNVTHIAEIAERLCTRAEAIVFSRADGAGDDMLGVGQPAVRSPVEVGAESPTAGGNDDVVFEPMRSRPDSIHNSSSLAWKYFLQVGVATVVLWVLTFGWIALYGSEDNHNPTPPNQTNSSLSFAVETMATARRRASLLVPSGGMIANHMAVERVPTSWPHSLFKPSALSCARSTVFLGERFAVHAGTIELTSSSPLHVHRFVPALLSTDISAPWGALGALPARGRVLLVEAGGASVLEYVPRSTRAATNATLTRHWRLGPSANFNLRCITGIEGDAAADMCSYLGGTWPQWAAYATTNLGEVVSLCPWGDDGLEPVRVVTRKPEKNMNFAGIALDNQSRLWLLARSSNHVELRVLGIDGAAQGTWNLPEGRHWAVGLCTLEDRRGLLVASAGGVDELGAPELWYLRPVKNSLAVAVSASHAPLAKLV